MGIPWSRPTDDRPSSRVLQEREVIESTIARDTGMNCHARDLPVPAAHLNNTLAEEASEAPSPSTPDRKADAQYVEPMLKVVPTEAFQRSQKSAAEAAAHPPEENGQAPAAEGAQKRRKRSIGSAPGDSHRSRKRRARAASRSQGTEAHGMHAHAEAEGQASGPPSESTPSSAAERRGQAQKSAATPAAQTPKSAGRKSKGWQYMGPDLKCAGVNQDDWVHCPDGRSYPRSMTYKEEDLLVEEYLDKTDDDQLYEVEEIIDERRWGKVREFRVKWKGFEMNPEEFMPYKNLKECTALDQWEAKLGILQPSER